MHRHGQLGDQQSRVLECDERERVLRNALAHQSRQFVLLEHEVAAMEAKGLVTNNETQSPVKSRMSSMETVPPQETQGTMAMFQWVTKGTSTLRFVLGIQQHRDCQ